MKGYERKWEERKGKGKKGKQGKNMDPAWVAHQMYSFLAQRITGNPRNMVKNLADMREVNGEGDPDEPYVPSRLRGLIAWQRVVGWNAAQKRQLNQWVHFLEKVSSLAGVPAALEAWDSRRKQFESLEKIRLAPTTVLDAMRQMLPQSLEDKVQTRSGTLNDEVSLKAYILDQCFEARPAAVGLQNLELGAAEREQQPKTDEGDELNAWNNGGNYGGNYGGNFPGACGL